MKAALIVLSLLTSSVSLFAQELPISNEGCQITAFKAATTLMKINGEAKGKEMDSKLTVNDKNNFLWKFTAYSFTGERHIPVSSTYEVKVSNWYLGMCRVNSINLSSPNL